MNARTVAASIHRMLPVGCAHSAIGKILVARVSLADLGGSKMTKPTNDEMHDILTMFYGPNKFLGDMLHTYYSQYPAEYRASRQYEFYDNSGADGTTVGDLANNYWSDIEYLYSNLELESGTDFLMEDGAYIALEVGN